MKYLLLLLLTGWSVYTKAQSTIKVKGDTLKIITSAFAIQNHSTAVNGYLANVKAGKTAFMEAGKNFQFTVGNAGAPVAGDSSYVNAYCVNKSVKVWREGLLQFLANTDGIRIDSSLGRIVFFPPLVNRERIYIEVLNGF